MCKRNSPDKNEPSTGCVRETLPIKINKINQHGMCKRNSQDKKQQKLRQHRMCQTNFPDKNEGRTGCVRETPHINTKSAMDVYGKLPTEK